MRELWKGTGTCASSYTNNEETSELPESSNEKLYVKNNLMCDKESYWNKKEEKKIEIGKYFLSKTITKEFWQEFNNNLSNPARDGV